MQITMETTRSEPPAHYLVASFLYRCVEHFDELPPGRNLVRHARTGKLVPFFKENVTAEQLATAIAEGRVYALWGYREHAHADIRPDWPLPPVNERVPLP